MTDNLADFIAKTPERWIEANHRRLGAEFTTAQVIDAMPEETRAAYPRRRSLEYVIGIALRKIGATKRQCRLPPDGRRAYIWTMPDRGTMSDPAEVEFL